MKIFYHIILFFILFFVRTLEFSFATNQVPTLFQLCTDKIIKEDLLGKEKDLALQAHCADIFSDRIDSVYDSMRGYLRRSHERISPLRRTDIKTPRIGSEIITSVCFSSKHKYIWVATSTNKMYRINTAHNTELNLQGDFFLFDSKIISIFPSEKGVCGFLDSNCFFSIDQETQNYRINRIPGLKEDEHIQTVTNAPNLLEPGKKNQTFAICTDKDNIVVLRQKESKLDALKLKKKSSLAHIVNNGEHEIFIVSLPPSENPSEDTCLDVWKITIGTRLSDSREEKSKLQLDLKIDSFVPNPFFPYEIICFNKNTLIAKNIYCPEVVSDNFDTPEEDGEIIDVTFLRSGLLMAVAYDSGYIKVYDLRKMNYKKGKKYYQVQSLMHTGLNQHFFDDTSVKYKIISSFGKSTPNKIICYDDRNIKIFSSENATKRFLIGTTILAEAISAKKDFANNLSYFLLTLRSSILIQKISTFYLSLKEEKEASSAKTIESAVRLDREAKERQSLNELLEIYKELKSQPSYPLPFWLYSIEMFLGEDIIHPKPFPQIKKRRLFGEYAHPSTGIDVVEDT